MTKDKKDLFDWTLALLINWQIEHLKKEYEKKSIDLEFFNEHNTLSLITLLTFPYFLASATLEHKGFLWYGTWVVVRYNHTNILVPMGYRQYVAKLYKTDFPDDKLQLSRLDYHAEDKIPAYNGYAQQEQSSCMQILTDGLKCIKFYTTNEFLEFTDERYITLMHNNSAIDLKLIFMETGKTFRKYSILKNLFDKNARHVYSKEHVHI